MSRRKEPVYAGNLKEARFARPNVTRDDDSEVPFTLYLTMSTTTGMVPVRDRQTLVMLSYGEVANILGAIPMSLLTDHNDLKAVLRIQDLMERLHNAAER